MALTTPADQRRFGGVQFGHQARAGPATGAQFNEARNGFLVVHSVLSRRSVSSRTSFLSVRRPAANDSHFLFPTRCACAHRINTPSPPGKAQAYAWEQPMPDLPAPPANPREHRPRSAVFLPVNAPSPRDGIDEGKITLGWRKCQCICYTSYMILLRAMLDAG